MQNTIQKFRQSSIAFEKPGILSENFKTLTSSNYPTVQYFHVFYLPLSTKGCVRFFLFYYLKAYANIKKDLVSTYSFFTLLLITQDPNKIKKVPHTLL